MTRRDLVLSAAAAASLSVLKAAKTRNTLGGTPTGFVVRARLARAEGKTFDMIEHCHSLGLSTAETGRPPDGADAIKAMRAKLESYGMRVIYNVPLPKSASDVDAFETAVKAAKETGAYSLHAAMTQRRYEQFDSMDAYQKNFAQCKTSIELAEPVLKKHRVRLAIENHKGWRASEQTAWLKQVSSEWVGVCFDFGNNISLCELPEDTFAALAPLAIFCHIKDMGVQPYEDGFLLSEVAMGEGVLDLKKMVDSLRARDPQMPFCLEMITRDPLQVPIFKDSYWRTMDGFASGRDVARLVQFVTTHPPKSALPRVTGLDPAAQLKAEDNNNMRCIEYARKNLEL